MNTELRSFLDEVRPAIEATLTELLPPQDERPERIHDAMRYSTMDGGKRIRPALCVAAFTAYKQDWKPVLRVAAAVEMIQATSPEIAVRQADMESMEATLRFGTILNPRSALMKAILNASM